MNIGSQYSYSSEDQAEFLVVVSREFDAPPLQEGEQSGRERVSADFFFLIFENLFC